MYCCISGCSNTTKKNKNKSKGVKFYYFPTNSTHMPWLNEKRRKWINAVKKHTRPNWVLSKNTTICSAHFIGQKKSENPLNPSYIPTIFPEEENQEDLNQLTTVKVEIFETPNQEFSTECSLELEPIKSSCRSVGCQKNNTLSGNKICSVLLLCNLKNSNGICTAEVQTTIDSKIMTDKSSEATIEMDNKVVKDFNCDLLDQHSLYSQSLLCPGFHGITSIKKEEDLDD